MKNKTSTSSLEEARAAADATRRKFATATALAQGLKDQVRSAKAQLKETRKKFKKLRKAARIAASDQSQARRDAEKAALRLRKLNKRKKPAPPIKKSRN